MIYGFLPETTYSKKGSRLYIKVIRAIRYDDAWQVWCVWHHKENDARVNETREFIVEHSNLKDWQYGKFGPN